MYSEGDYQSMSIQGENYEIHANSLIASYLRLLQSVPDIVTQPVSLIYHEPDLDFGGHLQACDAVH